MPKVPHISQHIFIWSSIVLPCYTINNFRDTCTFFTKNAVNNIAKITFNGSIVKAIPVHRIHTSEVRTLVHF